MSHYDDLMEIFLMSLALGMDAFSLAIGIGLQGLNRKKAIQLCASIGVFHIVMTLLGIIAGIALKDILGHVTQIFGALLLIGLGLHMMYTTLFGKHEVAEVGPNLLAMLFFSAGVSVDALSVGFSLGLRSTAYGIISAGMFGVAGAIMSGVGLFIGKRASGFIGRFGELVGAIILIAFGVHFLMTE